MNNQETYHIELVDKYFAGELKESEMDALNSWIAESAENLKYFKDQSAIWTLLFNKEVEDKIDVEAEWRSFKDKNQKETGKKISLTEKNTKKPNQWLRIAAIGIILIASVFIVYILNNRMAEELLIGDQGLAINELPDGSKITLNNGSSLTYLKDFNKDKRQVKLQGNGQFDVEPDSLKPFLISVNELVVEVLGTSFFINELENQTEVIVNSGVVGIYYSNNPEDKTILHAGESAIGKNDGKGIEKHEVSSSNNTAWKTRKMAFHDDYMGSVIHTLELVYGYDVIFLNPEIEKCRITASFDHQPIESVIKVLEATMDFKIKKTENTIEIDGYGCEE